MKKLILNLITVIMVCLFSVSLSSCSNDNEPKGNDLVEKLQGTWTFKTMKLSALGETFELGLDDLKESGGYSEFYDDVLSFNGRKVNGSEYYVEGNKILLPWYTNDNLWAKVSFSGSKMTMYYSVYSEGIKMELWITYTRSNSSRSINTTNTSLILPAAINTIKM